MKKVMILLIIVIVIVCTMSYLYITYKQEDIAIQRENLQFESVYQKEIYGIELATVINKAVDTNKTNDVAKDEKGIYVNNDVNSINIQIKMLDNDKTYNMESIYNSGISNFLQYYNNIKFKCTKIQYHKTTNRIKFMLFEQITQ